MSTRQYKIFLVGLCLVELGFIVGNIAVVASEERPVARALFSFGVVLWTLMLARDYRDWRAVK